MTEQHEQRLAKLEEQAIQQQAGSITLLGMLKEMDTKLDGLLKSVQVDAAITEARMTALESRTGAIELRLNGIEKRLGMMEVRTGVIKMQVSGVDEKVGQVLDLLKKRERHEKEYKE